MEIQSRYLGKDVDGYHVYAVRRDGQKLWRIFYGAPQGIPAEFCVPAGSVLYFTPSIDDAMRYAAGFSAKRFRSLERAKEVLEVQ